MAASQARAKLTSESQQGSRSSSPLNQLIRFDSEYFVTLLYWFPCYCPVNVVNVLVDDSIFDNLIFIIYYIYIYIAIPSFTFQMTKNENWRLGKEMTTCHVHVPRASACRLNADDADTRCRVQWSLWSLWSLCMQTKFGITRRSLLTKSEVDISFDSCWLCLAKILKRHMNFILSFACFLGFSSFRFSYPQLTSCEMTREQSPCQVERSTSYPPVSCGFFKFLW